MSGLSKEKRAANRELNQVFHHLRELVLNDKNYSFRHGSEKDQKLVASLNDEEMKLILEMFNTSEGSLPGELESEYIRVAYSPARLVAKIKEGKTFYEALSAIAWEVKNAHIELNPDLVQAQVKASQEELKGENLIQTIQAN